MKRFISIILSILSIVGLCGCENLKDMYSDISSELINMLNTTEEAEVKYETYYIENPEFNSCYNRLNSKQKNFYSRIKSISDEMTSGFVTLGNNYDDAIKDISIAYSAFLQDNAELFWMPNTYIISNSDIGANRNISIAFQYSKGKNQNSYTIRKSEREAMKAELDKVVNEITSQIADLDSDYEKEKYIHDYLCDTVTYTQDGEFINTAYGALVLKSALCEGYAKAFKLLCNKVDIQCDLITGESQNEGHMWNRVNIDQTHSYVDVTWDDRKDYKTYAYFNITEEQLIKTHIFAPLFTDIEKDDIIAGKTFNFTQKDCSFTGNTYYSKNDCVLGQSYTTTASQKIKEIAKAGENQAEFMFFSDTTQQIFEKSPEDFIGKIQLRLTDVIINSYIAERDTIILFFE